MRKWFVVATGVLAAVVAAVALYRYWPSRAQPEAAAPKPEAPPDLAKLREPFTAALEAIERRDAATAVRHLTSFHFGDRAVEEYRLYYLALAHELRGDRHSARVALARLWRRDARLVHRENAGRRLADAYAEKGDWSHAAQVSVAIAAATGDAAARARARWDALRYRFYEGDIGGALENARIIAINAPRAREAASAIAVTRSLTGSDSVPLTTQQRAERALALLRDGAPAAALGELTALAPVAPRSLQLAIQMNRGIALHQLRRYEDSNKLLEPLASSYYKYAIPAIYHAAKNYRIVSASINPKVYKTITERKRVGTVRVRVGKGKKRRFVKRPKYANVKRTIELIDLNKKAKKEEYDRLATERLKDLLQLPLAAPVRLEVLGALIQRAQAKNQDEYIRELVPEIVKLDPHADPALQYLWDKAWSAYTRGDLGSARPLFRFIADTYGSPNVKRQSNYWYARCAERAGEKETAMPIYRRLASAPYADLYALHAESRGAPRQTPRTNPLRVKRPEWHELAEKEMPSELRLAYELTALSALRDARLEVQKNVARSNQRFADALLADLYSSSGNKDLMYRSLRRAFPKLASVEQDDVPSYFLKMYYPMRYHEKIREEAARNRLDPHLVMALILQESYYNPRARSRVGATGLMQIMPPTGRELARLRGKLGAPRLEDPETNIELGTFHLRRLIDLLGGNIHLAVAAYNAGQGNVLRWRRAAPRKPMDEFLESIPFAETRNYVKRVALLRSSYERMTR